MFNIFMNRESYLSKKILTLGMITKTVKVTAKVQIAIPIEIRESAGIETEDEQRSIILDNAKLINGEIPLTSRIKVDKLFTLHKSIIKKSIAKINEETFKEVKNKLVNLFILLVNGISPFINL